MKIDYVVPYVTSNDDNWKKLFKQYFGKDYSDIHSVRFDDNLLFKYVFRGIEKYMPWINNVYLIVQSHTQVPYWISRNNVKIVCHEDFIPSDYLPTFNSCTIECFLHLIPGLSQLFIYGNDDTYIMDRLSPNDFFNGIMPKHFLKKQYFNIKYETSHIKMCKKMLQLVTRNLKFDDYPVNFYCTPKHCQQPFNKGIIKNIFETFKPQIEKSITRFRNVENISQYFFILYYMYSTNEQFISHIPSRSFDLNNNINTIIKNIQDNKFKLMCLNNNVNQNELILLTQFNKFFPEKSKYEI